MTRPDLLKKMAGRLFDMAQEAGAEALVVACPLCHANLDTKEREIEEETGRRYGMPVYYITELIGVALELPDARKWLKRHFVDPVPTLADKGLI